MAAAKESADARIARVESTIEGLVKYLEEKFNALDKRLSERCQGSIGRIEALEKSSVRLGERIGNLEAGAFRSEGGKVALAKVGVICAACGGIAVKIIEWVAK